MTRHRTLERLRVLNAEIASVDRQLSRLLHLADEPVAPDAAVARRLLPICQGAQALRRGQRRRVLARLSPMARPRRR